MTSLTHMGFTASLNVSYIESSPGRAAQVGAP